VSQRNGLHSAIVGRHTIRLPFPTWAWVSWGGRVQYQAQCEEEVKSFVEWHQPARYIVNLAEPFSNPWHQLTDGGTLKDVQHYDLRRPLNAVMNERDLGFLCFTAASAMFDIQVTGDPDSGIHPGKKNIPRSRVARRRRRTASGRKKSAHKGNYRKDKNGSKTSTSFKNWTRCSIHATTGKEIGYVRVPGSWLAGHSDMRGEFILSSHYVENAYDDTCQAVYETVPAYPDGASTSSVRHVDDCEHQSKYNLMLIDWKKGPHCQVAVRVGITQIHRHDWLAAEATRKLIVLS
jgi:hypothetical protein